MKDDSQYLGRKPSPKSIYSNKNVSVSFLKEGAHEEV